MRHRVAKKKLSMTMGHRKALLRNLSRSLILHGKVETTISKAKFFKPYVEKLVTKAMRNTSITNINRVNAKLNSKEASKKLFKEVAPRFKNRAGGYTKITKLGYRAGDRAPMARIEWVEDVKSKDVEDKKTSIKEETKPKAITKKPVTKKKATKKVVKDKVSTK